VIRCIGPIGVIQDWVGEDRSLMRVWDDMEQIDALLDENHFTGCGAGIDDSVGECAETNSPAFLRYLFRKYKYSIISIAFKNSQYKIASAYQI